MFSPKKLFILLVVLSLLVLLMMLFPDSGILRGPNIFILWILHALAGLGLIITTYREKVAGKARLFLLLAGYSAVGFLLGVVLHNLLYALAVLAEGVDILITFLNILEAAAFLIAVLLCPIALLVGIVGTFVLWKRIPT